VQTNQRQVESAQINVTAIKRRLAETQALFGKGIVARSEVDTLVTEEQTAQSQLQAAQDALRNSERKGGETYLKIARLELENRAMKARDVQAKLHAARVVAPADGVLLAPPTATQDGSAPKDLELGKAVAARDTLAVIGSTDSFLARAVVDEFDIVRLTVGLPVQVSIISNPNLVLRGTLARVSAQGRKSGFSSDPNNRLASFDIEVTVNPLNPTETAQVRVGMGVRMKVEVPIKAGTLLVPLNAVNAPAQGRAQVRVRDGSGEAKTVTVTIGKTSVEHIEVSDGLKLGDRVWSPAPPPDKPSALVR
jgi:hypothetical protein